MDSCRRVICPYSVFDMKMGNTAQYSDFNYHHSSDRMCSEQGNMFCKTCQWGIFRGRSDVRLIEREENFEKTIFVIQVLHNFKQLNGF